MENGTTNWGQSVTGVVIKENKVLLARHTYGGGKGLLIVPDFTRKSITAVRSMGRIRCIVCKKRVMRYSMEME